MINEYHPNMVSTKFVLWEVKWSYKTNIPTSIYDTFQEFDRYLA